MSGAAITYDIVASDPSHRSISEKSVSGCPPDISNAMKFPRAAARWFWAHLFSSMPHAKMADEARKRRAINQSQAQKPTPKERDYGER
jgi:hypothetical protein